MQPGDGNGIRGELIAGRFRVARELGAGGMATVLEVLDESTRQRLALKQLHETVEIGRRQRIVELFEREFHILAHLTHPHIVQVYDYGVVERGPYYTMELLDGGELAQRAPLSWRSACELARDVASALSIVHSRRLVYRDLNPRNVRCTTAGRAKLIDFGAMSAFGPSKQLVGTPAYCAPEALDFAPLDARTDLFSLGATLYFLLTGRHAFAARTFEQMRLLLESPPLRPHELMESIPQPLDDLVMDLLHPEASVRPANATEVVEQLYVIEGRTFEELPSATQAYLSTPRLVGRDALLERVRDKTVRANNGKGSTVLLEGASGVGRSRMVAACRIEAKLLGMLTLQADASDGQTDYGVLRALIEQLLLAAPELTLRAAGPELAVLGHAFSALSALRPSVALQPFDDHNRLRSALLLSLQEFFSSICRERPLLIAIDDLHAIDEPSAALIGMISRQLSQQALLVLASLDPGATTRTAADALRLLSMGASTTKLHLSELSPEETERLLQAVFGDVPNVQAIGHKLFETTGGNPRDLMQLAQFLVERELAQYRAGAWSLPTALDLGSMPADMAEARRTRVAALAPHARALASALSLTLDLGLEFEECRRLSVGRNGGEVVQALSVLQAAQIVRSGNETYAIAQRGWVAALQEGLDAEALRAMHLELAEICAHRGDQEFRRGQHLFRAGETQRALDVWVAFAEDSTRRTDSDPRAFQALVASLPEDWLEVYLEGIQQCEIVARPPLDAHRLRLRLAGLVNVMNVPNALARPQMDALLGDLVKASGLSDWYCLDAELDPGLRLKQALGAAQQRYQTTPEALRTVPVSVALPDLTRTIIGAAGMVSGTLDHGLAVSMPSLAPLSVLSPALAVVERLRRGALARAGGQFEQACAIYRELLSFAAGPERAGLDVSNHRYMTYGVMAAIGLMEASFGVPRS